GRRGGRQTPEPSSISALDRDFFVVADDGQVPEWRDLDAPAGCEGHLYTGEVPPRQCREDRGTAHPRVDLEELGLAAGGAPHLHAARPLQAEEAGEVQADAPRIR